jgi:cobalt-zinc-cadmium efflux system protein
MASLASSIILLVVLGGIAWEAIGRFLNPVFVQGNTVILVATIGFVINALTALLFVKGQKYDLNIRGAFLHMAADAGVSFGVVVAGIFILTKGWSWIDPIVSLMIVTIVFVSTWRLLRESMNYAIDAVPQGMDVPRIKEYLMSYAHVCRIHDLHVWPLSTTEIALTVHIVVNHNLLDNDFLRELQEHLHVYFGIEHATIQIETSEDEHKCMLDREKCV